MAISWKNLYVNIGAHTGLTEVPLYFLLLSSRKLCESLKNSSFFSPFSNILANLVDNIDLVLIIIINREVITVLTLLSMNINAVLFWDFRSLHKQMFSNCVRKLSIVDYFWFLHLVFPIHSIQEGFTEAVRISGLY